MGVHQIVYHCPELHLYRYIVVDSDNPDNDQDYKFDEEELVMAIATHQESRDALQQAQADIMAKITGVARLNPHKICRIEGVEAGAKISVIEPADYFKKDGK